MRTSLEVPEKVTKKVVRNSWESNEKAMKGSWESHEKVM